MSSSSVGKLAQPANQEPVIKPVNFTKSLSVYELAKIELSDPSSIGKTIVSIYINGNDIDGNAKLLGILSEYKLPPTDHTHNIGNSYRRSKGKYGMSDANGTQKYEYFDVRSDYSYYAATPVALTDNIQYSHKKIIIACWKYPDIERQNQNGNYIIDEYVPKCVEIVSMYKVPNNGPNKNIYIINAKNDDTYRVKVDGTEIPFVENIKYCDSFSDAKALSDTDDFMKINTNLPTLLKGVETLENRQQNIGNIITESKHDKETRKIQITNMKTVIRDIILHYNRKLLLDSKFVEFTDVITIDPPSTDARSTDQSSTDQSLIFSPSPDPRYMKTIIEEITKGTGQYYVWSDRIRKLKRELYRTI